MPDAVSVTLLDQLRAALQTINGSGDFTHDLSGSSPERVGWERIGIPPVIPYAVLVPELIATKRSRVLGKYRHDGTFRIVGWGKATADTAEARIKAALNMAKDIAAAVTSDSSLDGNCYDVTAQARSFVSVEPETGSEFPIAVVDVEVWYRTGGGS